jgi:hypothetical protein
MTDRLTPGQWNRTLEGYRELGCKLAELEARAERAEAAIRQYLQAESDLREANKQDDHEPYRAALIEFDAAKAGLQAALAPVENKGEGTMAKKMTPGNRIRLRLKRAQYNNMEATDREFAALWWLDGYRANRLTRAERAVVKAARECEQEWWSQGSLTRLRQRIADLEALARKKGGAR